MWTCMLKDVDVDVNVERCGCVNIERCGCDVGRCGCVCRC